VLATGCSALLGFVVYLAFTGYNSAQAGAESEARTTAQQVETAQRFPAGDTDALTTPLICYARSAVGVQWDRTRADTLGEDPNPWGDQVVRRHQALGSKTAIEQAAYSKWLDERSAREEARSDRIHGAIGVIPLPLWLVLFFTLGRGLRHTLFFATAAGSGSLLHHVRHDQREREEQEAQQEVADEVVSLASGDPRRSERDRDPDDEPDDAQAKPHGVAPVVRVRPLSATRGVSVWCRS
jgi:hypothetical protein